MKYHGEINYYVPPQASKEYVYASKIEWHKVPKAIKSFITEMKEWRVYHARETDI